MGRAPSRVLSVGEKVELIGEFKNGYYKVRTGRDEIGWAWARNVSVAAATVSDIASKQVRLLASTNLRSTPSAQEAAVRLLQPDEALALAEPTPRNGYYHVKTGSGEDGWIWSRSAVIVAAEHAEARPVAAAPVAVAKSEPPVAPVAPAAAPPPPEAAPVAAAPQATVTAVPRAPAPAVEAVEAPPAAPVAAAAPPVEPVAAAPAVEAPAPPPPAAKRPATADGLEVGGVLDRTTAALAKGMLPDEILHHYEQGEYANPIVAYPLGSPLWEASFVEATKRNAETLTIDERGTIRDRATGQQPSYLYGIPFPNIDPNDPNAAVKIIWNQYLALWYSGSSHTRTRLVMLSAKGVERQIGAEGWFRFYDGEPAKYRHENPLNLQGQFLAVALNPSDVQGTAALSWRYRDPNTRDSQWAFVPALRRVRAVSPANRSDGYLGSDISADDGYFFDGKPQDFEWKLVGKHDALRLVDPEAVPQTLQPKPVPGGGWESLTNRDGYYGYQTASWGGLPWALPQGGLAKRPVWIIEATPRDKYYLYGRLVLWIDAETWDGSYHQKFSWTGDHVLTYQVLARINQPTSAKATDETVQAATQTWAVAENFKMRRASLAAARMDSKSPYDRRVSIDTQVFDAGQLMRLGK